MFTRPSPRRTFFTSLAALLFLGLAVGVPTLTAQGVSYSTVTKGEFGGSLGTLMRLVPGANEETRETTHIQGGFLRTDSDESSTIMNVGEGRFTTLEHPEKSFFSFTLEEMHGRNVGRMAEATAQAEAMEAEAEQDRGTGTQVRGQALLGANWTDHGFPGLPGRAGSF